MPEPGRPSKLTAEVERQLVGALALGSTRADAAQFAGIDKATLRRWLARGAHEPDGPYHQLREAVLSAEGRAKIGAIGCITKAIRDGNWRAAAWFLERKWPAEYATKSPLFLVARALREMESAAEDAGTPLPEGAWEQTWAKLAREFSLQLPQPGSRGSDKTPESEGFDSPEGLEAALRLLDIPCHDRPDGTAS